MQNRQLKFRVWNKKTNTWVDNCEPNKNPSLDGVNLFGEIILMGYFMRNVSITELNNCVPLQYTGLKDKNGKEIFEGDIVKYKFWENEYEKQEFEKISKVEFINGCFYPRYIKDICEDGWYSWGIHEIEIIGNIFENKELLNE